MSFKWFENLLIFEVSHLLLMESSRRVVWNLWPMRFLISPKMWRYALITQASPLLAAKNPMHCSGLCLGVHVDIHFCILLVLWFHIWTFLAFRCRELVGYPWSVDVRLASRHQSYQNCKIDPLLFVFPSIFARKHKFWRCGHLGSACDTAIGNCTQQENSWQSLQERPEDSVRIFRGDSFSF
jgi:hypothetical protein